MKNTHLTKSEEELMKLFWNSKVPLTSVEILESTKEYSWNGNYLHVMLRKLLNKGMIRVCGTLQYGNQYARQFEPAIMPEEYGANLIVTKGLVNSISAVTVALANTSNNIDKEELITQLEEIIEKMKAE